MAIKGNVTYLYNYLPNHLNTSVLVKSYLFVCVWYMSGSICKEVCMWGGGEHVGVGICVTKTNN